MYFHFAFSNTRIIIKLAIFPHRAIARKEGERKKEDGDVAGDREKDTEKQRETTNMPWKVQVPEPKLAVSNHLPCSSPSDHIAVHVFIWLLYVNGPQGSNDWLRLSGALEESKHGYVQG